MSADNHALSSASGTMLERTRVGVLLFLCAALSRVSARDFSPTDVHVRCHNFENVVYWNNPDPKLQPEYTVTIRRYEIVSHDDLKTSKNYLDISNYTQDIEEAYFVSVKTQNGSENDSSAVMFTYKQDFPALWKKCTVDFPSVNTSAKGHTMEISFYHPLHIYDINGNIDDVFEYTVRCNETACGEYECMNMNETDLCTAKIPIPESFYDHCVGLHFIGYIGSTLFEGSKDVCVPVVPEAKTDVTLITCMVCGAVVLLMLAIVAGVEIYKGVTGSDPQRAISKFLGMVSAEIPVVEPERPPLSKINSISDTPLLITPDNDISTPFIFSPEEVTHMPITFISEVEEQRGSEEEEDFDSFTNNGGYDQKKFPLEMSPGDMVEAYHQGKN